ncbi:hypothetical protein JCM19301_1968 [Jejuia pallidilutea]|uniref:Peptidase M48 domain-containing protein n=2 Tax=Jejuia pallidilutea TaxID=504487 RepID=A0A090W8Q0_9FLAO|nr:hypothetical protein JCM19301_1968 [Jejuia pallidilutea]GAL73336.1 hypothetical protein JCM19302_402 [Jejuia pallidilutea]GAL89518.1 hypothetical protein JCM19538_1755 [Jejuia pallidilutea]
MIRKMMNRKVVFKMVVLFIVLTLLTNQIMPYNNKHIFPDSIAAEATKALSYFPELDNVAITFKFKTHIKKSTMQAQPKFGSFFRGRSKRSYVVLINKNIKIASKEFKTDAIPKDVMIGWLGHELGHIIDYQHKSNLELLWFGITYLMSENHIKEAERAADTYAVSHGMADYILKTKNFILNHAEIDNSYKLRIKKYYLSPEEIMAMVEQRTSAN